MTGWLWRRMGVWAREGVTVILDLIVEKQPLARLTAAGLEHRRGSPKDLRLSNGTRADAAVERAQFPHWSAKTIGYGFGSDDGAV